MTCEIGFIHMCASIIANGFVDNKIAECENYIKEKNRVKSLMTIRYDIKKIRERSQLLVNNLVKKELSKWWIDSRYNIQIDSVREEIMEFVSTEIKKLGKEISYVGNQNIIIKNFSDEEFADISALIEQRWPGMIFYFNQCF